MPTWMERLRDTAKAAAGKKKPEEPAVIEIDEPPTPPARKPLQGAQETFWHAPVIKTMEEHSLRMQQAVRAALNKVNTQSGQPADKLVGKIHEDENKRAEQNAQERSLQNQSDDVDYQLEQSKIRQLREKLKARGL